MPAAADPSRPRRALLRRAGGMVLLLALALALGAVAWRWRAGDAVDAVAVVQRDFVQTLVASGRVAAPHRVDIGAQITGTVRRVPVAEGQAVAAGTVLVELDATELRAALRQAETGVVQARERLRQLRELQVPLAQQALRQARATLDNAQAQRRRAEDLFGQGFIGQAALDDARKAAELADAQWQGAVRQLQSLQPAGSETALAEAALGAAQASAEAARARLGYATLAAPVAGTLIARDVEAGDVVQPGKPLLTLSPAGRTQLVVNVDEKNLRLLAPGQRALASADADPDRRFGAVLVYVNPGINAQTGAVEAKLDVPDPPALLRQDMTVSVDIEVARRPAALLAPARAVRDAADTGSAAWVLRIEGGRAVRRELRTGLRSGGFVEVLEGLAAGDRLVPVSADVTDGQRVRDSGRAAP